MATMQTVLAASSIDYTQYVNVLYVQNVFTSNERH